MNAPRPPRDGGGNGGNGGGFDQPSTGFTQPEEGSGGANTFGSGGDSFPAGQYTPPHLLLPLCLDKTLLLCMSSADISLDNFGTEDNGGGNWADTMNDGGW